MKKWLLMMKKENLVKCEDGSKTQTRRQNLRLAQIKAGDEIYFRPDYKTTYAIASGPYIATQDAEIQKLRAITDADAIEEGIEKGKHGFFNVFGKDDPDFTFASPKYAFANLINRVCNGPRWNMPGKPTPVWDENPEVVKISFRKA